MTEPLFEPLRGYAPVADDETAEPFVDVAGKDAGLAEAEAGAAPPGTEAGG